VGQYRYRQAHPLIELKMGLVELVPDHVLLWKRQFRLTQQVLNEIPVSRLRGHPPGRGVRMGQIAHILKGGHLVADRRRTEKHAIALDERSGADRGSLVDIRTDHQAKHRLAPGCHRTHPPLPLALATREC
jgi:hypothetical protein